MIPEAAEGLPTHPLPWLASFSIDDARMDDEHRAVMETANDLCALSRETDDVAVLRGAARELIAVTEAHFANEEALFPAIDFPGRLAHCREHAKIRHSLCTLLLSDGPIPAPVAAATARLILVEHLVRDDLGLKTWVERARTYR